MRDILFKNLTSIDGRKRKIASSEVIDQNGMRSIIHRHFVYMLQEVKKSQLEKPLPYLYVLKEKNTKGFTEKFFYRIKGSMYVILNKKLCLILYMHSLKINLAVLS